TVRFGSFGSFMVGVPLPGAMLARPRHRCGRRPAVLRWFGCRLSWRYLYSLTRERKPNIHRPGEDFVLAAENFLKSEALSRACRLCRKGGCGEPAPVREPAIR